MKRCFKTIGLCYIVSNPHHKRTDHITKSISFGLFLSLDLPGKRHLHESIFLVYIDNRKNNNNQERVNDIFSSWVKELIVSKFILTDFISH